MCGRTNPIISENFLWQTMQESYVVDLTLVEDMESEDQIEGTIPRRMMIITTSDYQTGPNNDHNPGRGGRQNNHACFAKTTPLYQQNMYGKKLRYQTISWWN